MKIPILAHSFNFSTLPHWSKRLFFSVALRRVERFVVYSSMEKSLYANTFGLPSERFDVVLWGARPPELSNPSVPIESGEYVCAIGGNARDYRTLISAASQLPHIRFVLVVRPENLHRLQIPKNVVTHVNAPYLMAMNILAYSRFMVLPLETSTVPCGHVTLVAAMHLGRAFIITDSAGVRDYVRHCENALTVPAASVRELVSAVDLLWRDRPMCDRLGDYGRRFAARECSEQCIVQHFSGWLRDAGILRNLSKPSD